MICKTKLNMMPSALSESSWSLSGAGRTSAAGAAVASGCRHRPDVARRSGRRERPPTQAERRPPERPPAQAVRERLPVPVWRWIGIFCLSELELCGRICASVYVPVNFCLNFGRRLSTWSGIFYSGREMKLLKVVGYIAK